MKIICPYCKGMGFITIRSEDFNSTGSQTCPKCHGTKVVDDGIPFDGRSLVMKYVTFKLKDIKLLPKEAQLIFWDIAQKIFKLGKEAKNANSNV